MDENKPHRSWLRFGLRDLLWLTVVVACLAGWATNYFHWHRKEPLREAAILLALTELRSHGITRLGDATNVLATSDGKVSVSGNGMDSKGVLRAVFIIWTVADFGDERRWQVEAVMIDGSVVRSRSSELRQIAAEAQRRPKPTRPE